MDFNNKFWLKGLVPAVFTPMTAVGNINFDAIPKYAEFLLSKGIKSVFVGGTTGEGPSLTIPERKKLAEAWMNNSKHGLENVIIHVGGANLRESQDMASHAANIKADGIGLVPPVFFKPSTIDILVEYCKEVAMKAPNCPFYYYNIPVLTGVKFDMIDFIKLMEKEVSTFRGIKYSNGDMTEASLCANYGNSKYNMVFGVDQQLLAALIFGIDAAIGSTYNFMAPIYHNLIKAHEEGNMEKARLEQFKTQQALDVMFKHGSGVSILKTVMTMCSPVDMGPCRLPLVQELPQENYQQLKTDLQQLGFFEWIK